MSTPGPVRVADVMATRIHSIDGLATVAEAIALMREHGVNALLVNRRDATDETGLALISDIAREVMAPGRSPDRVHVYEIMNKPALSLHPDMLTRYAVRLLMRFNASHAVVADADRNAVGLVTVRDLVLGQEAET